MEPYFDVIGLSPFWQRKITVPGGSDAGMRLWIARFGKSRFVRQNCRHEAVAREFIKVREFMSRRP
jgi:hypothetical protein